MSEHINIMNTNTHPKIHTDINTHTHTTIQANISHKYGFLNV